MSASRSASGRRFGLLWQLRTPDAGRHPLVDVYRNTLEEVVAAEEMGFDSAWLTEHHFVEDGYLSSPLTMLAALAARTSRIRIGPYVALASMYHPVRLAEDAAVVDLVSRGRLELAFGSGYKADEFDGLGIDRRKRGRLMDEIIAILQRAWMDAPLEFRGELFEFGPIEVTPKPVQQPVPLFLGSPQSRPVLERIARLGVPGVAGQPKPEDMEFFHRALAEHGRDPAGLEYLPFKYLWVDRDHERARRVALPAAEYVLGDYRQWSSTTSGEAKYVDADYSQHIIVGNPEHCIEQLEQLFAAGAHAPAQRLILLPPLLGVDHAASMRMMETFAAEVAPHFA